MNHNDLTQRIQSQIFQEIGKPKGFSFTKLTKVSEKCYRVNMYCQSDCQVINMMEICESYFIKISEDGTIEDSTPPIKKQ